MTPFVRVLADHIKGEVAAMLMAAPGSELRVFFAGPPASVLDEVFDALLEGSEWLVVEGINVPVFLLDSRAPAQDRLCSTRCPKSHLVAVRNNYRQYLALLPPEELTNRSIDTTCTWLGLRSVPRRLQSWVDHPVIQKVADLGIQRFFGESPPQGARDCIHYALKQAWEIDESHKDLRNCWMVLRRLLDCEVTSENPSEAFLAILGLPNCDARSIGSRDHLCTLDQLAELIDDNGIGPAFGILESHADEGIQIHVSQLRDHILATCLTPDHFTGESALKYSPVLSFSQGELPAWWSMLSDVVWRQLLDSGAPQRAILRVEAQNAVSPAVRGLPVIFQSNSEFQISIPEHAADTEIVISRAVGARRVDEIERIVIQADTSVQWTDPSPPLHERHIRYQFEAHGYGSVSLKCIVLDCYEPGVTLYCRNATKITPFVLNRRARDEAGRRVERFECDVHLHGLGAHQLDFYLGAGVSLSSTLRGYEVTSEQETVLEKPINTNDGLHAVAIIESDEECYYDFSLRLSDGSADRSYRVQVSTEGALPTGATSEFDRLLFEHRTSATKGGRTTSRVEVRSSRLADFGLWALESDDSYQPVIVGPDYLQSWSKPAWRERPVLTSYRLMLDPRPPVTSFAPPPALLEARQLVRRLLADSSPDGPKPLEMLHLAEFMEDEKFVEALETLIEHYINWLMADYAAAAWMDVVSVHRREAASDALEPIPSAILLTPLHPLRLAWQCRAQQILKQALDRHMRCPAASSLNPCSFPDSMLLPCLSAAGRHENKAFLALSSDSDYWSVLWNKDTAAALGSDGAESIFTSEFGLVISGLSSGFNSQQVKRSMNEVAKLSSGKSALRISIESDTTGSSSSNDGIQEWCARNLGPEGDPWYFAGPRSLHVYDYREESLQPEQASLAALTETTGATVRWFTDRNLAVRRPCDLAIVAHLGVVSPAFQIENLRSAVDPTGLARWRIRKQLPAASGSFIAESRVGEFEILSNDSRLCSLIMRCADRLETLCSEEFDSYVFAPNIPTLDRALQSARYCAVSSSTVDTACFFRATSDSYLWDYELPSYSRRAGENAGYYLLARQSPVIIEAVSAAISRISGGESLPQESVPLLLTEISRRGMPTLKRLTAGGVTSLGEIGMLVALRLLQPDFGAESAGLGLCPIRSGGQLLNLVLPVDPFRSHLDDLNISMNGRASERPDLLIAGIHFDNTGRVVIKLTPVEVKARGDVFPHSERPAALEQAKSLSQLLSQIKDRSETDALWGIAWRSLIAAFLDYGFRVYGQLDALLREQEWVDLHKRAIQSLMKAESDVQIDMKGRLIVTDSSPTSAPWDIDGDAFSETVVLTHADAFSLLTEHASGLQQRIRESLGDWSLAPCLDTEPNRIGNVGAASETTYDHQESSQPVSQTASVKEGIGEGDDTQKVQKTSVHQFTHAESGAPTDTRGIELHIGERLNAFNSGEVSWSPGVTDLNQLNVGVVGDLGTGKTQLLQALLHKLRANPEHNRGVKPNVLIFDYKHDYSKKEFVQATGARVVNPFAIPLNMFDASNALRRDAWLERSKFFSDTLDKLYSGIGPAQRQRIKEAVRRAYQRPASAHHKYPTIYDVFDEYTAMVAGNVDSPYAIMSDLVDGGYFARDPQQIVNFSEFIEGVVVFDLGSVGQDDRTKNMLVVILLNLFYEHMLQIPKKPFIGDSPQYRFVDTMLLVDEADNIMSYEFDVLKRILLQGREFGVGVVLASQYLSHFRTTHENYAEPLLTWFVHKVPHITVRELEMIGLTRIDSGTVDRVKKLQRHECLYKSLGVDGEFVRAQPFYEWTASNEDAPRG
jgi:DNA phosphorothioation-dependent restriction protein DptH